MLKMTPANGLKISWGIPSTECVLQQCLDLAAMNWSVVTNSPALDFMSLENQITLSPLGSAGFYRLAPPKGE